MLEPELRRPGASPPVMLVMRTNCCHPHTHQRQRDVLAPPPKHGNTIFS
ncbi:hypothetical protein FOMG_19282 [Fusarium oxysporum f. sp. melonis 26406]|uniref:Uncharacterized protein n=1 Tax=Fusarium oxysporum f. sp. melonis 26406 TaxID=1089452 RepID=W9Z6T0_FUSOX|nr:hypothetical protein FOMG_19282 [Fusarium oxysporum f. sp. melonis 26406]